jgi:hypothetical protein
MQRNVLASAHPSFIRLAEFVARSPDVRQFGKFFVRQALVQCIERTIAT